MFSENWFEVLPWQFWVLLSGVVTGLAQMLGKSQVHKISAAQMGALRDISGGIVAFFIWRLLGSGFEGYSGIIAFSNGALVAVGVALYFKAVRSSLSGSTIFGYLVSQVMIVLSSAFIFAEWVYFDPRTWVGLGNLLAFVLTVFSMLVYVKSLKLGRKWVILLLMSAVINVVGNLVAKFFVSGQMNVWNYFFLEQEGLAVASVAILFLRGQNLRVGWKNARIGVLQGMIALLGPIIYLNILAENPLSLASLVRRIAAIGVTSVSGLLYYKEKDKMGRRAWISLAVAILAFGIVMFVNR